MADPSPRLSPAAGLRQLLAERGIADQHVLDAIEQTPREKFVDATLHDAAYDDRALSIGAGQTISQPFVVARMTELLDLAGSPGERVLEIGTGSGYQTAILARLADRVVTIERIESLAREARRLLDSLGITNVEFHVGDGSLGWPAAGPYDGIVVTAAAPRIPESLIDQLRPGGRLVIPVGDEENQVMQQVTLRPAGIEIRRDFSCRFVPLIGRDAWDASIRNEGD